MGLYTDPNYFEKKSSYQGRKISKVVESIKGHFIRPCYLRESETPLKFYKLIARIGLPLGFILNLFRAMQATTAIGTATEAAKPYFILDAVYMWVGIALVLGSIIGLNKMEWYGVKCYASLFSLAIAFNAFLAIYSASLGLYEFEYFGRSIFAIVFLSVWLYFCLIYFGKRRLLFSPGTFNDPPEWAPSPDGEPAFHDQTARSSITPSQVEPEPPSKPEITAESNPPAVIPEKPRKKGTPRALVIVLATALVISLAGNIWQGVSWASGSAKSAEETRALNNKITQLNSAIASYRDNVGELKSQIKDLESRNTYFNEYMVLNYRIGFIVDGSAYYHRYSCPVYRAADEYTAHNIEYCRYLGYSACPVCWD